jgi:hypothetical protein
MNKDFKSCSTSSIFLNTTINSPNVKIIIKAVSTILQSQILEDIQLGKRISSKSDLYYFSEEKYIKEFPNCFDEVRIERLRKTPSLDEIVEFIEVYIINFRHYIIVLNSLQNAASSLLSILIE